MAKKKAALSDELREAIVEAAKAGAIEAYGANTGSYVNYFKATETLLYNYKRLQSLIADEEAYCEVEYHGGKKSFAATPRASGYYEHRTQEEIVEDMQEEKRRSFNETKFGFERLQRTIALFEDQKEFVVVRLYYFGEDINGNPREGKKATTWDDVTAELEEAGVLKESKTARRWRNKIVNDMAVCIFGIAAAVSAGTYRTRPLDK